MELLIYLDELFQLEQNREFFSRVCLVFLSAAAAETIGHAKNLLEYMSEECRIKFDLEDHRHPFDFR